MPRFLNHLRARLLLLVLGTTLPALTVVAYFGINQGERLLRDAEQRALSQAADIAKGHDEIFTAAREILATLSVVPALRSEDPAACRQLLTNMQDASTRYTTFLLTDPAGRLTCVPEGIESTATFRDREYFQRALETRRIALGEFVVGRVSKKRVLPMAYPVLDEDGTVWAVLITAIDLEWLDTFFDRQVLADNTTARILDRRGTILAQSHKAGGSLGQDFPDPRVFERVRAGNAGVSLGQASATSDKVFAFAPLTGEPPIGYVVVSMPKAVAVAAFNENLMVGVLTLLALTALALVAAWVGSGPILIKPVMALRRAADAMRRGDLAARVGPSYPAGELGDLGQAFDHMADAVQAREQQLELNAGELRRVNKEMKEQESMLHHAQKMEVVGQLTGGVAHDFNNLLTVILGSLQLLERRANGDEKAHRLLETAKNAALRGAQLTRQLLAFSRRQVLKPTPLDINELILQMRDILTRTLGQSIEIRTKLANGLCLAKVDQNQLESALLNLAVNAADVMPDGGVLTIETSNAYLDENYARKHSEVTPGPYVLLAVSDTGPGMTQEVLQKAFEPFFTTKQKGKGTGLGLSMVYGFVKQSGGHIKIYSELGYGTTVKLFLPKSKSSRPRKDAADESAELPVLPTGGERVLVVEDEPEVRETAVTLLTELGYRVVSAETGVAALDVLQGEDGIDLLFTDIIMPGGMNGIELGHKARQRFPGIRILYTSGYTEAGAHYSNLLTDGAVFIAKPYLEVALAQAVRRALDAGREA